MTTRKPLVEPTPESEAFHEMFQYMEKQETVELVDGTKVNVVFQIGQNNKIRFALGIGAFSSWREFDTCYSDLLATWLREEHGMTASWSIVGGQW